MTSFLEITARLLDPACVATGVGSIGYDAVEGDVPDATINTQISATFLLAVMSRALRVWDNPITWWSERAAITAAVALLAIDLVYPASYLELSGASCLGLTSIAVMLRLRAQSTSPHPLHQVVVDNTTPSSTPDTSPAQPI